MIDKSYARGIMGASFGGVASLHTAWRNPGLFGRLCHRNNHLRNLESVYQIIEHGLERCVSQIVLSVMNDEQRIAPVSSKPCGQVDLNVAPFTKRLALDLHGFDRSFTRFVIVLGPVRSLVSIALTD